jgi:reactive intermediate/imine deaminase
MFKAINPEDIVGAYGGTYNQAVEVPAGARMLYVSGQVGMAKDGSVPEGIEAQSELLWTNIGAILRDAGMGIPNIVKMNAYITDMANFPAFAAVRKRHLAGHKPASTAVAVAGLVEKFLVEVEVIAAAKD